MKLAIPRAFFPIVLALICVVVSQRSNAILYQVSFDTSFIDDGPTAEQTDPRAWKIGAINIVSINPGESIQEAVDSNPEGAIFLLKAGVHRHQTITPKDGNIFVGERGLNGERLAILTGARRFTYFIREGPYWVLENQTQEGDRLSFDNKLGLCYEHPEDRHFWTGHDDPQTRYEGCVYPEDLFIDDVPLWQVTSLADVEPGKWHFDYSNDKIYFADNLTGRRIETSVTQHAFRCSGNNVIISGLIIEKYATPAQDAAVRPQIDGCASEGYNWIVEHNEIRFNHGRGVDFAGNMTLRNNYIHTNGQLGVGGNAINGIVEGNEIAYNNYAGYSVNWEAGGAKFGSLASNFVIRNNYVHDNNGVGIWTDWSQSNILYEGNWVIDNGATGIFHEVSGSAVIHDNVVEGNGFTFGDDSIYFGAGIRVVSSPGVEIYGNALKGNRHGIIIINIKRGRPSYRIENLNIHDNQIHQSQGAAMGFRDEEFDDPYEVGMNIRVENNIYLLPNIDVPFHEWAGQLNTREEWQALGNDENGVWISQARLPVTETAPPPIVHN